MVRKKFSDYRQSHQGRGDDYDITFRDLPHRALIWEFERRYLDRILDLYPSPKSISYLDFACGTGRVIRYLENKVGRSVGVDVANSMLECARARCSRSILQCVDITKERYAINEHFDLITAFRFFPNAEPPLRAEAIRALTDLLKPDGRLVFNNHLNSRSLMMRMMCLFRKPFGDEGVANTEMEQMIRRAGLRIENIFHVGVAPAVDQINYFPTGLLRLIEECCARLAFLSEFAQDVIFVCKHAV